MASGYRWLDPVYPAPSGWLPPESAAHGEDTQCAVLAQGEEREEKGKGISIKYLPILDFRKLSCSFDGLYTRFHRRRPGVAPAITDISRAGSSRRTGVVGTRWPMKT